GHPPRGVPGAVAGIHRPGRAVGSSCATPELRLPRGRWEASDLPVRAPQRLYLGGSGDPRAVRPGRGDLPGQGSQGRAGARAGARRPVRPRRGLVERPGLRSPPDRGPRAEAPPACERKDGGDSRRSADGPAGAGAYLLRTPLSTPSRGAAPKGSDPAGIFWGGGIPVRVAPHVPILRSLAG